MNIMIPGKTDEEQAWQALRRQVAEHSAEQSFTDDKRRLGDLENKFLALLNKVEKVIGHYEDLTKAYDRLVTRLEFAPFKVLVWGLVGFTIAVMLIFLSRYK